MILYLRKTSRKYDRVFDATQQKWNIVLNECDQERSYYLSSQGGLLSEKNNFDNFIYDSKKSANGLAKSHLVVCAQDLEGQNIDKLPDQIMHKFNNYNFTQTSIQQFFPNEIGKLNFTKLRPIK